MYSNLLQYLHANNICYETNVSLKKKTWIHRGGMCDVYISPVNRKELIGVVRQLYHQKYDFLVIGHSSNIYILNSCNVSVIVSTKKCSNYEIKDGHIYCDAGVGVTRLAKDMTKHGIAGFEYLTDLPGTVAAAIYNNASCKKNSISQLLVCADVILPDGRQITLLPDDFGFVYRGSCMKRKELRGVIVGLILKAEPGNALQLQNISSSNIAERRLLLESYAKTLGSTMNNCFSKGRMPLHYYLAYRFYNLWLKLNKNNETQRRIKCKDFICKISGYADIARYVSNEDIIIFIWKDEKADAAFPRYLEFMDKVYRTQDLEIEVVK